MSERTNIEWCDSTFNPFIGCTKVSPGCDNCYAEHLMDHRMHKVVWGPKGERIRTSAANWVLPKRWNAQAQAFFAAHGRRQRVFCASLADVFDNAVPIEWLRDVCSLIELTPNLDWLLLTKRIAIVFERLIQARSHDWLAGQRNVWLGITVVNQEEADRDIPKLLRTPARRRFLSMEPLLGPVDLGLRCENWSDEIPMDPETGAHECCKACDYTGVGNAIDWVIVGGESGPDARPMHPDWARSLRDQCQAAGVPFFFKQFGEWHPADRFPEAINFSVGDSLQLDQATGTARIGKKAAGRLLDGRTWDEVPA